MEHEECLYPLVIPQSKIKTQTRHLKHTHVQVLSKPCGGQVFHMHKYMDKNRRG